MSMHSVHFLLRLKSERSMLVAFLCGVPITAVGDGTHRFFLCSTYYPSICHVLQYRLIAMNGIPVLICEICYGSPMFSSQGRGNSVPTLFHLVWTLCMRRLLDSEFEHADGYIEVKEMYFVCGLTPKRSKLVSGECSIRAGERAILFIWDVGSLTRSWPVGTSQTRT